MDEDPRKDSKDLDPDYNAGSWELDSSFNPYPSLLRHMNNIDSQALRRPLAFAQTCKQLRAEYRPFWLSHTRLRVDVKVLQAFTDNILLISDDYKYALKELYISYSYNVYNQPDAPIDVTPLVILHAYRPTSSFKSRSHEMLEDHREECPYKYCVPWGCIYERSYKYKFGADRQHGIYRGIRIIDQQH